MQLLAKNARNPDKLREEETLSGHSQAVVQSFKALFGERGAPSRLGKEWTHFFGLSEHQFDRFWLNGVTACVLHDLGKANGDFQSALLKKPNKQVIWHEHLGALVLSRPPIDTWLTDLSGIQAE
ncbi:MAG: hypothetical protein R6V12_02975, partial [Candidatus Hydrogenedentota bacterium]